MFNLSGGVDVRKSYVEGDGRECRGVSHVQGDVRGVSHVQGDCMGGGGGEGSQQC